MPTTTFASRVLPVSGLRVDALLDEEGMEHSHSSEIPDPQVPARSKRRSFTRDYKMRILREHEAASKGGRGVLLRREPSPAAPPPQHSPHRAERVLR